ncbi:MAG: hypothetical protein AAGC55_07465, partial [Myxococcota bacterium]
MSLLGIRVHLMIGPTVPVPVPLLVGESLEKVKVTHKDKGRSGFQLTFRVGRASPLAFLDHPLLAQRLIEVRNRVIIIVMFGANLQVLFDGFITHQQLLPGNKPGETRLVVNGEDLSCALSDEEKEIEHPAQDEYVIVNKIILSYAQYGLIPLVVPPGIIDPPIPIDRIPVQRDHDLGYLHTLAKRHGYVFYIMPG